MHSRDGSAVHVPSETKSKNFSTVSPQVYSARRRVPFCASQHRQKRAVHIVCVVSLEGSFDLIAVIDWPPDSLRTNKTSLQTTGIVVLPWPCTPSGKKVIEERDKPAGDETVDKGVKEPEERADKCY